jgi:transcriptional regulator with PAS, ATPase and Fis domain
MPDGIGDMLSKNVELALQKNQVIGIEFSKNDIHQKTRYFNATFYPAVDKSNEKSIGVCIQLKEITETAKAKAEIEDLKNFYQKILNNLPTDIAVLDKNYKYLFINPQAIANPDIRTWLIGKDDYEYASMKNISTDFADRRKSIFSRTS